MWVNVLGDQRIYRRNIQSNGVTGEMVIVVDSYRFGKSGRIGSVEDFRHCNRELKEKEVGKK